MIWLLDRGWTVDHLGPVGPLTIWLPDRWWLT